MLERLTRAEYKRETAFKTEVEPRNAQALEHFAELVRGSYRGLVLEQHLAECPPPNDDVYQWMRQVHDVLYDNLRAYEQPNADERAHDLTRQTFEIARLNSGALALWDVVARGEYASERAYYDELIAEGLVDRPELVGLACRQLVGALNQTELSDGAAAQAALAAFAADWPLADELATDEYKRYLVNALPREKRALFEEPSPALSTRLSTAAKSAAAAFPVVGMAATLSMSPASAATFTETAIVRPHVDDAEAAENSPNPHHAEEVHGFVSGLVVDIEAVAQQKRQQAVEDQKPETSKKPHAPRSAERKDAAHEAAIQQLKQRGGVWVNRAIVLDFFISKGLSLNQASGVLGNLIVESGGGSVNPRARQYGGGPGRGIAQWTLNERWAELKKFAGKRDIYSLQTQLDFMWHEMTEVAPWDKTLPALKKAKSIEKAVWTFEHYYEKAGKPNYEKREDFAREVQRAYKQTQVKNKKRATAKVVRRAKTSAKKPAKDFDRGINRRDFKGSIAKNHKVPRTPLKSELQEEKVKNGKLPAGELEKLGPAWGNVKLHEDAAEAFRAMSAAFKEEFGHNLQFVGSRSGYRSLNQQHDIYATSRPGFAAKPGHSNHGWGVAVDLKDMHGEKLRWMQENAIEYGFVHPHFARPDGPSPEPWHWEYNAVDGSEDDE